MRTWRAAVSIGAATLAVPVLAAQPSPPATATQAEAPREPTDVYVRRKVGLPPESARGNIEIVDVGHSPFSPMISIVAHRSEGGGWRVSYVCAESDWCTADRSADHHVLDYALAADVAARLDAVLAELAKTTEPGGAPIVPTQLCGYFDVRIDLPGFRHDYSRECNMGEQLGAIRRLISPPQE